MRSLLAASLAIAAPLGLAACFNSSYAGIPFAKDAADPELQSLARLARSGDKHAQLKLGIRYEEGRGVPVDLERARDLYFDAATNEAAERISIFCLAQILRVVVYSIYFPDVWSFQGIKRRLFAGITSAADCLIEEIGLTKPHIS